MRRLTAANEVNVDFIVNVIDALMSDDGVGELEISGSEVWLYHLG